MLNYRNKIINIGILFIIAFQSFFYLEHINNDYKLLNEYRYIDSTTILNNKKEVSTIDYIDNNLLFNLNDTEYIYDTDNIYFNDKSHTGINLHNTIDKIILYDRQQKSYKNLIDETFNYQIPHIKYNSVYNMLYTDCVDEKIRECIEENKFDMNNRNYPLLSSPTMEKLSEKMNFIESNVYEENLKILDRYYFHEGSFMLAPINEMNLGRDKGEIFSQYGFLSISIISKVMDLYGGFSINNFEKAKKTLDLIYFLSFVGLIFILFRESITRLNMILVFSISFFSLTYFAFSYAPTVTNTRHFLDLLILIMLYKYGITKKIYYMAFSAILSIISIYIAKDFGQFIFLSIIAVLIIPLIGEYKENRYLNIKNLVIFILTITLGLISFKTYPMMDNPSIKYFLDGFYSFPFKYDILYFLVLLSIFLQWIIALVFFDKLREKGYLQVYIFVSFYTQFLYTYFIWHGTFNNVSIYLYLFLMPYVIAYNIIDFKFKKFTSVFILVCLSFFYLKSYKSFAAGQDRYNKAFESHKIYKWNHPRAGGIEATYSFESFENSIDLINKYNKDKKYYPISKYDNVLSILSEKYTGYKFFELRSSIVTSEEFDEIVEIILGEADIIFVDNDINRDYKKEMDKLSFFDINKYWRDESKKQRIPKLQVLTNIFNEVKNEYRLVEKGKLISVYKKIK